MAIINGRGRVGIRRPSAAAAPSIILDGLKLYLDAGNATSYAGTGTVWTDISGNGNNGTLVNGGSGLNFVSANGGSLQFDGLNDYIRILTLNPYLNNVNKFTYQTWIKITNLSKFSTIFSFGQSDNYNNDILIFYTSNILGFQINKGADGGPTLPYTSTGWNNISIVYDGTQTGNSNRMKVYINGVLGVLDFNTYTVPSSTSNIGFTNAGIGAYSTGNFNNPFTGNISVSKLYTRALSAAEIAQNYNAMLSRFYPVVSDADAQSFVVAAGLTSSVQANAVNTLVASLKSAGIWTKMKAIYPMVGGSAASHKFNLKDPRDLHAAYRLTFGGTGWVHSSTGAKPNGADYANTNFNVLGYKDNNHISLYITSNIDEFSVDMGVFSSSLSTGFDIESRISNNSYFVNFLNGTYITVSNTDSRGFYINSRTLSNLYKIYKNNILKATNTTVNYSDFTGNITIGGRLNVYQTTSTVQYFSSKNYAFASIGDGLTDTEASNFYTAVQTYQTALGRQV